MSLVRPHQVTMCVPELEKKKRSERLPVSTILNRIAQLEKKAFTLSKPQEMNLRGSFLPQGTASGPRLMEVRS